MKKNRNILIIISALFLALDILNIIMSQAKTYTIMILLIIYLPFLLIIIFSDNWLGKVVSIGFCAVGIIFNIVSLIGYLRQYGFYFEERAYIYQLLGEVLFGGAFRLVLIISIIKFFRGTPSNALNATCFLLLIISAIFLVFYLIESKYSTNDLVPVIQSLAFDLVLMTYVIYISQKVEKE